MTPSSNPPAQAPGAGPGGAPSPAREANLFREIFEATSDAVAVATAGAGEIVAANRLFLQLVGRDERELRGQPLRDVPPFASDAALTQACLALRAGESLHRPCVEVTAADGTPRKFELVASGFGAGPGALVHCSLRDITAVRIADQRLHQARKMEGVRLLASSAAHDFNNVLSCIRGYVSIALETGGLNGELREILTRVKDVSLRAGELPQRLLDFSRQRKLVLRPVDLAAFARRAGAELQATLPAGVTLHVHAADAVPVQADEAMLRLALTLLLRNAREAIADAPGEIALEATRWTVPAPLGRSHGAAAAAYARLSLRDSGRGMSAETQERLFEPGFTTKKTGKTAAMSLATVYRIAVQHGGWVDVSSAEGRGSTFALIFPLDVPPPGAAG